MSNGRRNHGGPAAAARVLRGHWSGRLGERAKIPPNVYEERTQGRDSGLLSQRVALTSQACGPEVALKKKNPFYTLLDKHARLWIPER